MPLRLTAAKGVTGSFVAIDKVPVLVPACVGLNVTERKQIPPRAKGEEHPEPEYAKSPVIVVRVKSTIRLSFPVFVISTNDGPVVCPMSMGENEINPLGTFTTGTAPIPEVANEIVGMEAFEVNVSVPE
jgi:hypothetical protein